jgi:hypothetical protein
MFVDDSPLRGGWCEILIAGFLSRSWARPSSVILSTGSTCNLRTHVVQNRVRCKFEFKQEYKAGRIFESFGCSRVGEW